MKARRMLQLLAGLALIATLVLLFASVRAPEPQQDERVQAVCKTPEDSRCLPQLRNVWRRPIGVKEPKNQKPAEKPPDMGFPGYLAIGSGAKGNGVHPEIDVKNQPKDDESHHPAVPQHLGQGRERDVYEVWNLTRRPAARKENEPQRRRHLSRNGGRRSHHGRHFAPMKDKMG